jgi:hypothetical protein
MSPGYPCCCDDPTPICDQCQTGTTPAQIQLNVPIGAFANNCPSGDCENLEGIFVLDQRGPLVPCDYDGPIFTYCASETTRYRLQLKFVSVNLMEIFIETTDGHNKWRLTNQASPIDCNFANLSIPHESSSINNCDAGGTAVTITAL